MYKSKKSNSKLNQKLTNAAKNTAKKLAKEAGKKLYDKYDSLMELFYAEKSTSGRTTYDNTFNLFNSYDKYYFNQKTIYYGGIKITPEDMEDYPAIPGVRGEFISAERLIDKFIYIPTRPSIAFHGGDYHGGYGIPASFSFYDEINYYRQILIQDYKGKVGR